MSQPRFAAAGVPAHFKAFDHWVCFRTRPGKDGKLDKLPLIPGTDDPALVDDPSTWRGYDEAAADAHRRGLCLGFAITPETGIVFVERDACVDPSTGEVTPEAFAEFWDLDAIVEYSTSRTGIHAYVCGTKPGPRCKNGPVEMYDGRPSHRFAIVTGDTIDGLSGDGVGDRQPAIDCLYAAWFPAAPAPPPVVPLDARSDDAEIVRRLHRMGKGARFYDDGDWGDYPSQSEADGAFSMLLVRAGAGDEGQADRIFRSSAFYRQKDEKHRRKWERGDYRTRTLGSAFAKAQAFEGWGHRPASTPPPMAAAPPTQSLGSAPDACDRRVAELEAMLAERDAEIARLRAENARLDEQVRTIQAVQSSGARILANRGHGPARVMASALAQVVAWRATAGETPPAERDIDVPTGMVPVSVKALADRAGCSENTAGTHLAQLAERGLIRRFTRTVPRNYAAGDVDRETGEIYGAPITKFTAQHFVGPVDATALTPRAAVAFANDLAAFSTERVERRGGKRIPRCPEHPNAGVTKRWVAECDVCHRELAHDAEAVPPMMLDPAPIPKVWAAEGGVVHVTKHTNLGDDSGPSHLPGFVPPPPDRFTDPTYTRAG